MWTCSGAELSRLVHGSDLGPSSALLLQRQLLLLGSVLYTRISWAQSSAGGSRVRKPGPAACAFVPLHRGQGGSRAGGSQSRSSLLQADAVPEHRMPMPVLSVLQELCLIRFHPATEEEEVAYISLYSYFSSRGRFGVVANNSRHIKDLYLIPLSAEDPVPSKLLPFEGPGEHRLSGWWSGTSAHTCPLPPHKSC